MFSRVFTWFCLVYLQVSLFPLTRAENEFLDSGGSPECACIDPWEAEPDECRAATDGLCKDANYGASKCSAWDCIPSSNQYCERQWCYVDPTNCRRTTLSSTYFPGRGLSYSYGTCGFKDWSPEDNEVWLYDQLKLRLKGFPLRIAYPGDDETGYKVVTDPRTCVGLNCTKTGAYPDFVLPLLAESGIEIQRVSVSGASKAAWPVSSFSACVHEVNLGGTDLCIGNFWTTAVRYEMATFSATIDSDTFRLITSTSKAETSFLDYLRTPYEPFSGDLWAAIICTIIGLGGAVWFVDRTNEEDFGDSPASPKGVLLSMYLATLGMASGGPAHTASSPAAKIINIGYGLFILLVLSGYTANLASTLVSGQLSYGITSMDAAIKTGAKVCIMEALRDTAFNIYPELEGKFVTGTNDDVSMDNMNAGRCQVAIVSEASFGKLQRIKEDVVEEGVRRRGRALRGAAGGKSGAAAGGAAATAAGEGVTGADNCDKAAVGNSLFAIGSALPIRSDLQGIVSALITRGLERGRYKRALEDAMLKYLPPEGCGDGPSLETSTKMTAKDFTGPFLSCAAFTLVGLVVYAIEKNKRIARNVDKLKKLVSLQNKESMVVAAFAGSLSKAGEGEKAAAAPREPEGASAYAVNKWMAPASQSTGASDLPPGAVAESTLGSSGLRPTKRELAARLGQSHGEINSDDAGARNVTIDRDELTSLIAERMHLLTATIVDEIGHDLRQRRPVARSHLHCPI